jgi:electron transfer flavoprotein beta subunit
MKTVVCIKQVPATHDVKIDPLTKRLIREGVEAVINPFDVYALEQAVLLRERLGGEVIALSMGPPSATAALREAIAGGADGGILLSDRAFAGSDTWATSYALAMAISRIGGVDLVLCGKQAIDGDTAQVGPGIAAHLNWPQATYAAAMPQASAGEIAVRRMHEDGYDVVSLKLPAVVTVVKEINTPRVPTLRSRLASRKALVPVWSAADVGAEPSLIGLDGSPTRVVRTSPPPGRGGTTVVIDGQSEAAAGRLLHELRMKSLV